MNDFFGLWIQAQPPTSPLTCTGDGACTIRQTRAKRKVKTKTLFFNAASAQMSCPSPQNALWIVFVLSGETEQRGRGLGKRATRDVVVGETPWQDAR